MTSARKAHQNIAWVDGYLCPTGKRGFSTRADAKAVRTAVAQRKGDRLSVYRCDDCDRFHLGHLPRAVREGEMAREELRQKGNY